MAAGQKQNQDTPERIIISAQELFAEKGFGAVSLRDITNKAQVNVAAINYHFNSKEELIDKIIERHALPINKKRLEHLKKAGKSPSLKKIIEAFILPVFTHCSAQENDEKIFPKFLGHMMQQEHKLPEKARKSLQNVLQTFTQAICKELPSLTHIDAAWGIHYTFGITVNYLAKREIFYQIMGDKLQKENPEKQMQDIITFCVGGFQKRAKKTSKA